VLSSRIRLLLLIPTLDQSGAEKQLTLLATHLPRDEFEVQVVALTRGGPYEAVLQEAGIPVTILGKQFKLDVSAGLRLRRLLREWKPDVLHTWLFAANAYGRLAVSRKRPFSIVVSERCVDTRKAGWQLWLDRQVIGRTDRLVGNSQAVAEFYRQVGYPAERVRVIPNGMEVNPLPVVDREAVRKELGFAPDAFLMGYAGRLAPQKRVLDLLWAFELLRVAEPNTGFLILGDGPERAALEHFADRLQMRSHVRFLGHQADVPRWLAVLDGFWLASSFEGQSNSLMEAMAAGLPVVSSDIPPNLELVTDDVTGIVAPLGDRAIFARAALNLLHDPQRRKRLGDAARARIASQFSVQGMVEGYAGLYRELAART
jgi:glycosyltransferase involved in cell wall biosynthesis